MRTFSSFFLFFVSSSVAFQFLSFPPTMRLESTGKQISLHGRGPPVVFSSGLFGLMPRRIYTDLVKKLSEEVTLVVLDDMSPVTADIVEDVANTLAAERVGFFAHSSIDAQILASPRLHMAVLCDPVVLPEVHLPTPSGPLGFVSPTVDNSYPVLVIKARKAYDPEVTTPIPEFLAPAFVNEQREVFVEDVGHADLLDDPWADLGRRVLPWMKGVVSRAVPFSEWNAVDHANAAPAIRDRYRSDVARWALDHMLRSKSITNHTFIDV